MQHFFHASPAIFGFLAQAMPPSDSAESLLQQLRSRGAPASAGTTLLIFVLTQVVAIVAYWLSSKAVAREEENTLGNAFKVWILYILVVLGVGFLAAVGIGILLVAHLHAAIPIGTVIAVFLYLVLVFSIPMKVYQIGFFRAFGFQILAGFLKLIGLAGVSFVPGNPMAHTAGWVQRFVALSPAERQKFLESFSHARTATLMSGNGLPGEVVAGDRSKPLPEREAALKIMYYELEKRRQSLKVGDQPAVSQWEVEKGRYEKLLQQLQAEAAGSPK